MHDTGESKEYVDQLLIHLGTYNWPGAPRYCGSDSRGVPVFSPMAGHVARLPWQPADVWTEPSLVRATRLVRQFHDLTAGTRFAGDAEVACHNDLAPRTTVFRDEDDGLRPYGFLGWELAAPGLRVNDLAHLCWQFLDLGPNRSDPAGVGRLMRLMCDTYELGRADRERMVPTILWWQDTYLTQAESEDEAETETANKAESRSEALTRLRLSREWVEACADILDGSLRPPRTTAAVPSSDSPP